MKNNQHGGEIIAFRIPPEALTEIEALVKGNRRTVSTWARTVVLEALAKTRFPVQVGLGDPAKPAKSWGLLSTVERVNMFQERDAAGYKIPIGFEALSREDKLAWLDANWPIKEGE